VADLRASYVAACTNEPERAALSERAWRHSPNEPEGCEIQTNPSVVKSKRFTPSLWSVAAQIGETCHEH